MKKFILTLIVIVSCIVMLDGSAFANNIENDKSLLQDAITTRCETYHNMKNYPQESDKYFHEYLNYLRDKIQYMDSDIQYTDEEIKQKREMYSKIDIMFDSLNEFYYPSIDYVSLTKHFTPVLSKGYKNYLKIIKTQKYTTMEDELIIPFDELRKRIIAIENFLDKYPKFAELDSLHEDLAYYLKIYIDGIGSLNLTDPKSIDDKTKKEIINSYKRFLKDDWNRRFDFYRIVKNNYELLIRK